MSKKLLFTILAIAVAIGASMTYVFLQKDIRGEPEKNIEKSTGAQVPPPSESHRAQAAKGAYVDYTEEAFASAKGEKLLFFHAPWCPQCRALDKSIKASDLPDGVTIFKVDYDSRQALREKYGVTLQTTVVKTDESGNKTGSYVAYDEPTFQSVKRALLP